jgi:hypothetical protein
MKSTFQFQVVVEQFAQQTLLCGVSTGDFLTENLTESVSEPSA